MDIIERLIASASGEKCLEMAAFKVITEIRADYNELILAVAQKFPGETRHQTALRYIKEAENNSNGIAKATL